jgi:hypothetical protein
VPEKTVKTVFKAALISSGMDADEADAMASASAAGLYAYDFGDAPSSKNAASAGKAALKAGVESGVSSATKTKKTETTGGAILDQKGISHMALDSSKHPITRGGSVIKKKIAKPLQKSVSHQAAVQDAQMADPNEMFKAAPKGGSMRPIGGGSMRPIEGGSMRPIEGGGAKTKQVRFAKGSEEARKFMASLREKRKKK